MNTFLRRLHPYWYIFSVLLTFLVFFPFLYYFSRKPERYLKLNNCRKRFAFWSSALAGFFYRYQFKKPIDWTKPVIVCANHTSNLDISAITVLMQGNFAFLGKVELLKNPVMRLFFKTIDIAVDRDSKIASFKAFKRADEYLAQGMSLVIFPEGKIGNEYPPILHEFKNGPFRLAIERKVPIVPVTLDRLWELMWDDGFKYGSLPGKRTVLVHEPIETDKMTVEDADQLKEMVYQAIANNYASN